MSHPLVVLAVTTVAGASLAIVRWTVRGNADPFAGDWPLYLPLGSLALTFLLAAVNRRPFVTAAGVYCGLVGYMLFDGRSEYPVASVIALAVNGLLPALAAAAIVFAIGRWNRRSASDGNKLPATTD